MPATTLVSRCLSSPLFRAGSATLVALGSLPFAPVQLPLSLIAGALSLVCFRRKELTYETSILPTLLLHYLKPKSYPWSSAIVPHKLFLSALPLQNMDHQKGCENRAVLTLLEKHELAPSIFTEPVQPAEWERCGAKHCFLETPDFYALSQETIKKGVAFVREQISAQREVLVHCKAGRGRSATIAICYLLKHGKEHGIDLQTVEQAIQYVKERRPVININRNQRQAIDQYRETLHENPL